MDMRLLLVGVDFRSPSLQAARWAAGLAGPDATLELAHVLPRQAPSPAAAAETEVHRRLLAGLSGFASTLGAAPDRLHVRSGDPAEELCALAETRGAGVLVLGRNLDGGEDGRTRERLLRRCAIPVLVVGSAAAPPSGRIVVALNEGSGEEMLRTAASIARRRGAELVAVHVAQATEAAAAEPDDRLRARLTAVLGDQAAAVQLVIRTGDPAEELLAHIDQAPADLLVIGANARRSDDLETLGRTTRALARLARVPVLIVPGGGERHHGVDGHALPAREEWSGGPRPAA